MDTLAYAAFTERTAIYPKEVEVEYLALGLCSEVAELTELFNNGNPILQSDVIKELGDSQWYACRLANAYSIPFVAVYADAVEIKTASGPVFDRLVILSGLIAGDIKKQIRDGKDWTGEEREECRQKVRLKLVKFVRASIEASTLLSLDYEELLQTNVDKLRSRQERGVLGGSGDNR